MDPVDFDRLKNIDIKAISLNKDLGRLNFQSLLPTLERFNELLLELNDLNYKNLLTPDEVVTVNNVANQFFAFLGQLTGFDIGQTDSQTLHDNLQNQILNWCNSSTQTLRPYLIYLRQEADKVSDKAELRTQQREAAKAKQEFEELSKQLKYQIEELNHQKQEVENKHGELASKKMAIYFQAEAELNQQHSSDWLKGRNKFYKLLVLQISINLAAYLIIFVLGDQLKWISLRTKEFFTIQYGLINFSLLSLLSYGLIFASKNYNIRENLASINRHRRNVAMTLEDFLETKKDPEMVVQMMRQGTEAMFKHFPLGFVNKNDGAKDSGPVLEVINPMQKLNNT